MTSIFKFTLGMMPHGVFRLLRRPVHRILPRPRRLRPPSGPQGIQNRHHRRRGHGGNGDSGAVSPHTRQKEKDLALDTGNASPPNFAAISK